ncbi:Uma2 family endonuclease [Egbenema bharatensis]|uniref:Uma2 family endonuclease n=1 Tax=Egbenema bharatensis TaxID=3463334 RepID=UPI003A8A5F87
MGKKSVTTEQRVVLSNVSWTQFEELLQELGIERQARLTYRRGQLELMTPIPEHDRCHKLLESFIMVLVDEFSLPVTEVAPVLLTHVEMGYASEPDACYYFREEPALKNQTEIDLTRLPAPDLVVEVALTKSNIEKLPIYAALGIPEVWRYITTAGEKVLEGKLLIYQLQDGQYQQTPTSRQFSSVNHDRITLFIEHSDSMSLATAIKMLRAWVKGE